jgi:hypothetical protein
MSGIAHRSFLLAQLVVQAQRIVPGAGGFSGHFESFSASGRGLSEAVILSLRPVYDYRKFAIMLLFDLPLHTASAYYIVLPEGAPRKIASDFPDWAADRLRLATAEKMAGIRP